MMNALITANRAGGLSAAAASSSPLPLHPFPLLPPSGAGCADRLPAAPGGWLVRHDN